MSELVEIVAREMAERRIRLVRKWDTDPEELEKRLPKAIDRDWPDHTEDALAALRAIEGAGYKVGPGWQLIDGNTPRDRDLLTAHCAAALVCQWDADADSAGGWIDGSTYENGELRTYPVTHWMELPALPTDAAPTVGEAE